MKSENLYQHYKGGLYIHIGLSEDADTGKLYEVYKSVETGKLWHRREKSFHENVVVGQTDEGSIVRSRFSPIRTAKQVLL